MNLPRSDLGQCPSRLTYVMCFKIPVEKYKVCVKLARADKEYNRIKLLRQAKVERFRKEINFREKQRQKLEEKLQNVKSLDQESKYSHCEIRSKILVSSTERNIINMILKRAKWNLRNSG
ncbi:hypothetical protein TNCT_729451 [Trichonephila clavata]|uniref:Uncharacterized protein n=1 Tax=Trichonephila clavata TaxID=2740835 RepID=A0A8X6HI38_TRICU|nr:hypothetical protein TNCT_729451 [Trichonephila clavata]